MRPKDVSQRWKAVLAALFVVTAGCDRPVDEPQDDATAEPARHGSPAECAAAPAGPGTAPDEAGLGHEFQSGAANVHGTTLHYVRGGSGPPVILLHGFPQDWSEWRQVMPALASDFNVVAVDLRGIGGSRPTPGGYDAANLAGDIRQLADRLDLELPYVAGHDIGGFVAYAYARRFPEATRGVMVLDVPLPGIDPWQEVRRTPLLWHFHFHQVPDLPEALVSGREAIYFRDFLDRLGGNPDLFSDEDVARFAAAYGTPCALRAGFEFYRAFPENATWNASQTTPLDVPITLAAGERATAQALPAMAGDLRQKGVRNVTTEVIAGSGHYVVDERPEAVATLITRYARRP